MRKYIFAASAAIASLVPLAASAQDVPSYAQQPDQQIRGRVTAFDGAYAVTVRDDNGYTDNVELHPGTIINPTGITIQPGMVVSILGYNDGSAFAANEVDTPYTFDSGVPYYEGHAWDYYGPSIGLTFFFGSPGWWHGSYFNGPFSYDRGARVYNNVNYTNIYNNYGGNFRGRNFVATNHAYAPNRNYSNHVYAPHDTTIENNHTTNVYAPHTTTVNSGPNGYRGNANAYTPHTSNAPGAYAPRTTTLTGRTATGGHTYSQNYTRTQGGTFRGQPSNGGAHGGQGSRGGSAGGSGAHGGNTGGDHGGGGGGGHEDHGGHR